MKLFGVIVVLFLIAGCGLESRIDSVADSFYKNLQSDNYEAATALADTSNFESFTKEEFIQWLKDRNRYWGKIKSYKRYLTDIDEGDSLSMARFNYLVVSERDTIYEFLEFEIKGEDIKIVSYGFSPEKEDVTPIMTDEKK